MVSTMNTFAEEFPELALPATGEVFPDPQVLVLNEPLATELGLDPESVSYTHLRAHET